LEVAGASSVSRVHPKEGEGMTTMMVSVDKFKFRLVQWLEAHGLGGVQFVEDYDWTHDTCRGYSLHCTMVGSDLMGLVNFDWCFWDEIDQSKSDLYDEFSAFVGSLGYWFELGYAWSIHFYTDRDE
jgi:hypothetical protein